MLATANPTAAARLLVVADWRVDPYAVVAALRRRANEQPTAFTLVVPAWLHGLDWVGDPAASVPCAERQLDRLLDLAARARLDVEAAGVGDPDVMSAIGDALDGRAAAGILLMERPRRLAGHPLDLAHRARRATGLSVSRIAVPGPGLLHGGGHCRPAALQPAQ